MSNLENDIINTARGAISESIVKELTGYNKPLNSLVSAVISDNKTDLYRLINDEFSGLLNSSVFKDELKLALNKKLASVLVSRMGGDLEKKVNELKSNPETRAKVTLALSKMIDDLSSEG